MAQRADHSDEPTPQPTVNVRLVRNAAVSTDFEVGTDAPESFGDYEMLGELGSGGMGRVFKARQKSSSRVVALKTLRTRDFHDPAMVQRFHKEAEAAAQLDHPGIVPVYEFGAAEGQLYFTMGLVDGQGLDERLHQGPLDNRTAALVVQQIAEAVAYAHRKGVVHRDLKPANVLLDQSGSAKITDFGIARRLNIKDIEEVEPAVRARHPEAVGTAIRLTQAGTILGTPGFMSPEQTSTHGKIGPNVDIWALGAILYSCLTGRPPFVGATALETLALTVDTEPVPPNEINPDADAELVEICMRCLHKEIRDRFSTADEVAAELAGWREGKAIRSPWALWRTKLARYLAGMPELVPLSAGLLVQRLGNMQEGLVVAAVLAGINLSHRRKRVGILLAPAGISLILVLLFPCCRLAPEAWLKGAGAGLSGIGLLALLTTIASGLFALDAPRSATITPRNVSGAFLVFVGAGIIVAFIASLICEYSTDEEVAHRATQVNQVVQKSVGWLVAIPLGLAIGSLLGQLNNRLNWFGPEPLPLFALGSAFTALGVALIAHELRVDITPQSSRYEVLGPGALLNAAELRAGNWLPQSVTVPASEVRQSASAGIFCLKLLFLVVPMALGGTAASLVTRLIAGGRR